MMQIGPKMRNILEIPMNICTCASLALLCCHCIRKSKRSAQIRVRPVPEWHKNLVASEICQTLVTEREVKYMFTMSDDVSTSFRLFDLPSIPNKKLAKYAQSVQGAAELRCQLTVPSPPHPLRTARSRTAIPPREFDAAEPGSRRKNDGSSFRNALECFRAKKIKGKDVKPSPTR